MMRAQRTQSMLQARGRQGVKGSRGCWLCIAVLLFFIVLIGVIEYTGLMSWRWGFLNTAIMGSIAVTVSAIPMIILLIQILLPRPSVESASIIESPEPRDNGMPGGLGEAVEEVISDGTESPCVVCRQPIEAGAHLLRCPFCGGLAHYDHMREWLHTKGMCPVCRRRIQ